MRGFYLYIEERMIVISQSFVNMFNNNKLKIVCLLDESFSNINMIIFNQLEFIYVDNLDCHFKFTILRLNYRIYYKGHVIPITLPRGWGCLILRSKIFFKNDFYFLLEIKIFWCF